MSLHVRLDDFRSGIVVGSTIYAPTTHTFCDGHGGYHTREYANLGRPVARIDSPSAQLLSRSEGDHFAGVAGGRLYSIHKHTQPSGDIEMMDFSMPLGDVSSNGLLSRRLRERPLYSDFAPSASFDNRGPAVGFGDPRPEEFDFRVIQQMKQDLAAGLSNQMQAAPLSIYPKLQKAGALPIEIDRLSVQSFQEFGTSQTTILDRISTIREQKQALASQSTLNAWPDSEGFMSRKVPEPARSSEKRYKYKRGMSLHNAGINFGRWFGFINDSEVEFTRRKSSAD